MKRKNIPTPEQAERFQHWMLYWRDVLSLGDWRIERSTRSASKGAMAEVMFDDEARMVTYRLGDWAGTEINERSLKETALHEMLHVRLHDVLTLAQDRLASADQIAVAEHGVINVLERLLMGDKP